MKKDSSKLWTKTFQLIGIAPSVIFILILIILTILLGLQEIWVWFTLLMALILAYALPQMFWYELFDKGENKLSENLEVIKLEKDQITYFLNVFNGFGFGLLIPGLIDIQNNKWFLLGGLFLLAISNLIYYSYYFPRYAFLIRKSKIDGIISKNHLE